MIISTITAAGLILRLFRLGNRSLWLDEASQYFFSASPLGQIFDPGHPPLSHYILHFFLYAGDGEIVLRLPSVFFGAATIPLVYVLSKLLFGDNKVALLAAGLSAVSPFLVYYGQEARMYSQLAFFAVASSCALLWWARNGTKRAIFLYLLLALASLYTHFYSVFLLLAHNAFILWDKWRDVRSVRMWFLVQGALLVLFVPLVPILLFSFDGHTGIYEYDMLLTAGATMHIFNFGRVLLPTSPVMLFVLIMGNLVFATALIAGFFALREPRQTRFLVSLVGAFIFILVTNLWAGALSEQAVRYVIFLAPFYYVVIAKGVTSIRARGVRTSFIVTLIFIFLGGLYPYYFQWDSHGKGDFRQAAAFISDKDINVQRDFFAFTEHTANPFLYYVNPELEHATLDVASAAIRDGKYDRVFLVARTQKGALEVMRSGTVEAGEPPHDDFDRTMGPLGYASRESRAWPGKNRIEIHIYHRQ